MLKSVYIKNIKGLRGEHFLNFEAKGLKQTQMDNENSIGVVNGTKIMKAPILIAKNASGKSTMLDAIEMGMRYKDLDEYLENLSEEILFDKARSLINFTEGIRNDLNGMFIDWSDTLAVFKKDQVSKDMTLNYMNKIVKELKSAFASLGSSLDIEYFDDLSCDSLTEFGGYANEAIQESLGALVLFNPRVNEFFDFSEEFEIKLVDTDNNVRSINNDNLREGDITDLMLKNIMKEIQESVLLPIWDAIHVVSEVIEDSTEVYSSMGAIDQADGFNSYSRAKSIAKRYAVSNSNSYLFNSDTVAGGRNGLRSAIKYLDKEMGQEFLESIIKMLDKNISHVEANGKNLIIINNDGRKIAAESLSYGTKKIIELINFAIKNREEGFIMIDEIENGLNISLINLLYRLLDEMNLQVISTTHNPSIIYQGIVSPVNAFVNNGESFVSARDVLETKRPANLQSLFRPENYMNDFHIVNNATSGFSTNSISSFDLDKLLDSIEDRFGVNA